MKLGTIRFTLLKLVIARHLWLTSQLPQFKICTVPFDLSPESNLKIKFNGFRIYKTRTMALRL